MYVCIYLYVYMYICKHKRFVSNLKKMPKLCYTKVYISAYKRKLYICMCVNMFAGIYSYTYISMCLYQQQSPQHFCNFPFSLSFADAALHVIPFQFTSATNMKIQTVGSSMPSNQQTTVMYPLAAQSRLLRNTRPKTKHVNDECT